MKHYLILKFKDDCDKDKLINEISNLFKNELKMEGLNKVDIYRNCVNIASRADLLILIEMEKEALEAYKTNKTHLYFKEKYSSYLQAKTVIDCE